MDTLRCARRIYLYKNRSISPNCAILIIRPVNIDQLKTTGQLVRVERSRAAHFGSTEPGSFRKRHVVTEAEFDFTVTMLKI